MKTRLWKSLAKIHEATDMSTRILLGIAVVLLNHVAIASDTADLTSVTEIVVNPKQADPRKDCTKAIQKSDFRFVGIYGIVISLPGVEHYDPRFPQGVKVIKGSGDHADTPAEWEFQTAAETYAKEYNQHLLQHLSSNAKRPPR
jgi:hypothetical protein